MIDKHMEDMSPVAISKHVTQIREKWDIPVIYVRDCIIAYNRKRLIVQNVPFIVPGTQMYLPALGIDLREHFRITRTNSGGLRPAAQAVLIHVLLRGAEDCGPTALAEALGYSAMTMSRALDELETAGLVRTISKGRTRHLHLANPKREVWKKAQPILRTPIVDRYVIRLTPKMELPGPRAGFDALANYSMLAEPVNICVAISRETWKAMRETHLVSTAMMDEPGTTIAEIWSYAPDLLANGGWVDRLSLYLSLRDTQDERVLAALDKMIMEIPW